GMVLRRLRALGLSRVGRALDALLDDHGIDIVIFNECNEGVHRLGEHPFLVTLWDVDDHDWPEFPDIFTDRMFERRTRHRAEALARATGVIVNSETGARRVRDLY